MLLAQDDAGLTLTRLESWHGGREGAAHKQYLLFCYYTGLCTANLLVSSVFCLVHSLIS